MKLRKFFGLTSRSVLEQVRAELGADAVIVANHATSDGVEVTALAGDAIDTLLAHGKRRAPEVPVETPAATTLASIAERNVQGVPGIAERRAEATPRKVLLAIVGDEDEPLVPETPESIAPSALVAATSRADALAPQLMAEVAAMREMIEERFALMSWNDSLRRRPLAAKFTRD